MSSSIDLKELWNKQNTPLPDTKKIFIQTQKFKRGHFKKLVTTNIILLSTSAFIFFVWYHYQPEMITTKIGILLIILAMFLFLFVYNQTIPLLLHTRYENDTNQYLQQMLKLKEKQSFLQKVILNIYFILLLTGISLYMYEYAARMTTLWACVTYGVVLLWLAINWFYFRPKIIKKQQSEINRLINKLERVSRQLNTNE